MQTLYWKDLEAPATGAWRALAVNVNGMPQAPSMRLLSGRNFRVKLVAGPHTLFWATAASDYSGVWLMRTMADLPVDMQPIGPIDSAQVEACAGLPKEDRFKAWCRFFVEQLRDRPGSFLHDGSWLLRGMRVSSDLVMTKETADDEALRAMIQHWRYEAQGRSDDLPEFRIEEFDQVLALDPVYWINWWLCGNGGLIALRQFNDSDGRIKWWRKKVREDALPPVLALYLKCLDAFVIVDGHCRLRAALLEGVAPDVVVIVSTRETPVESDPAQQERVVASLFSERSRRGRYLSVDRLNQILIAAFDDRPIVSAATHARATLSDDQWITEVRGFLHCIGSTDYLDDIVAREAPPAAP